MSAGGSLIMQYRAMENDYPLQRDVQRVLREFNPTTALIKRPPKVPKRYPLDHPSQAKLLSGGVIKWRSLYVGDETRQMKRSRRALSSMSVEGEDEDTGGAEDNHGNQAVRLRLCQEDNRKGLREIRRMMRHKLAESEHRLCLARNGLIGRSHTQGRSASTMLPNINDVQMLPSLAGDPPPSRAPGQPQQLGMLLPLSPPTSEQICERDSPLSSRDALRDHDVSYDAEGLAQDASFTSFFFTEDRKAPPVESQSNASNRMEPRLPLLANQRLGKDELGLTGNTPDARATPHSESGQQTDIAANMLLRKKYRQVQGSLILSREFAPVSPVQQSEPQGLSSKLLTHPGFRMRLAEDSLAFNHRIQRSLRRSENEQQLKYEKKFRALDVSGEALPFRATAGAVLHHVEDVIRRDESQSVREEAYRTHMAALQQLRDFLSTTSLHPKVEEMLRVTQSMFGVELPSPGPSQFFDITMGIVSDFDLMFFDVTEACVHIGALYGVPEEDVVRTIRKRAARFIFDRPTELLQRINQINALRKNSRPQ